MFDLPRNRLFPVREIDIQVSDAPHRFEADHRLAIARNWDTERARKPSLFDGRVVLLSRLVLDGETLRGTCHECGYSAYLYWRQVRDPSAGHVFAHAVPVCRDGAVLAIRMGQGTTHEGEIYFASGSFDPLDFRDGRLDSDANMRREVAEETGLDLEGLRRDPLYHVLSRPEGTIIARRYELRGSGAAVARRIKAYLAGQARSEISAPVLLHRNEAPPPGLAPHMPPLLDWCFSQAIDP